MPVTINGHLFSPEPDTIEMTVIGNMTSVLISHVEDGRTRVLQSDLLSVATFVTEVISAITSEDGHPLPTS